MNSSNQNQSWLWTTDDGNVAVQFTFEKDKKGEQAMRAKVYWPERPNDYFLIPRCNTAVETTMFHQFPRGDLIQGTLKGIPFFDENAHGDSAIWGDFFYRDCQKNLGHFEGVMVTFSSNTEYVAKPPEAPAGPLKPNTSLQGWEDILSSKNDLVSPNEDDLFPYIYLNEQQGHQLEEAHARFIRYTQGEEAWVSSRFFHETCRPSQWL